MKKCRFSKVIMPLLLLVGTCTFVCSCNNDDDVNGVVVIDQNGVQSYDSINVDFIDQNTVLNYDSLSVDFRLINSEGQAVKIFKEGEQIIFRLTVTNLWDKTLRVNKPGYIVGEDLFQIYSNGKPVGKPWDYSLLAEGPLTHLWSAHKSYVYECPWQGLVYDPEMAIDINFDEIPSSGVALLKIKDRQPLPVGNYYTEFKLILNENSVITCHKDFSVIAK